MAKPNTAPSIAEHFVAWQCQIRQLAMREEGGRPVPGMQPRVLDSSKLEMAPALTVLMVPKEPDESTAFFRYQVMKTPDPRTVYERALTFLQADYFQDPDAFSDRLLAVLSPGSSLAESLCARGECILAFEQGRQRYELPCTVRELKPGKPAREAAIWHNRLFNPALPDAVHVLGFKPDWASVRADPWPGGRKSRSP
jgi:hypothetical protein